MFEMNYFCARKLKMIKKWPYPYKYFAPYAD